MAIHSSILVWTEEPGELEAMGRKDSVRLKQLSTQAQSSKAEIWCFSVGSLVPWQGCHFYQRDSTGRCFLRFFLVGNLLKWFEAQSFFFFHKYCIGMLFAFWKLTWQSQDLVYGLTLQTIFSVPLTKSLNIHELCCFQLQNEWNISVYFVGSFKPKKKKQKKNKNTTLKWHMQNHFHKYNINTRLL